MKKLYISYEIDHDDYRFALCIEELESDIYGDYKQINYRKYYVLDTKAQLKNFISLHSNIDYNHERLIKMSFKNFKENLLWLEHNKSLKQQIICYEPLWKHNELLDKEENELPLEKSLKDFQEYILEYCDKHKIKTDLKVFNLLNSKEINKRNINSLNNQLDDLYNNGLISEQTYFKEKMKLKESKNEKLSS